MTREIAYGLLQAAGLACMFFAGRAFGKAAVYKEWSAWLKEHEEDFDHET